MKTIGLIGGMSWESTLEYYRIINETVRKELGGLHLAKILLSSVDFAEIEKCQASGEWDESARILADAAVNLEKAGADFFLICTNTMHKVADAVIKSVSMPFLHIASATAESLIRDNVRKAGLLGTKYTMTQDFYKDTLDDAGIDVVVPDAADAETVNSIIYDELCLGVVSEESRKKYIDIIMKLKEQGAEGIILGCTEIGLLVRQNDIDINLYDTTRIHSEQAARIFICNQLP